MSDSAWPPAITYRPQPPGAAERMRLLVAEAEKRFGNATDAARWYYNQQAGLGTSEPPHRIAQDSAEGLKRVLDLLAGLDITPRPDPYPHFGKRRKR